VSKNAKRRTARRLPVKLKSGTDEQRATNWSLTMYKNRDDSVFDVPTYADIAAKVSAATGISITAQNIEDWYDGGETFHGTDHLIRAYMGKELYDAATECARCTSVFQAKLDGCDEVTIGGITFHNLQK
jgi:hypothetical protein